MIKKHVSMIIAGLLLSVVFVAGIFSCKKNSEACIESMCRYAGYCDSVKCICPPGFAGKYCDSILLTGDWKNGRMLCSPYGADSNWSMKVRKVAGDTTKLMIINIAGTGDTIIADMQPDGSSASFRNYIVHGATGNDTINGGIYMSGYDHLNYNFLKRNSVYIFTCQAVYTH